MPVGTSTRRRRAGLDRRTILYLAAALVALGVAERGARVLVSRHVLATAGARWIWAPGAMERSEPVAFYAVRDFELDTPPEHAYVHVLADEAYILHLNGRRVGSGAYFARAPLDTYALDRALRPGWNRVAVELRSGRGAGGLLLALFADGERDPLVMSGEDWRIFGETAGVVDGTRPFADGEPALVWQSPPHGGWGAPRLAPERATFDRAVAAHQGRLDPLVLEPRAGSPVAEGGAQGSSDFGREVTGYLLLRGLERAPRRMRVEIGLGSADDETLDVVLAAGQTAWSSAEVRTLRYVSAPDLPEGSPSVIPVDSAFAAEDARRASLRRRGVFGVDPPHELRFDQ
ncbi:MAG TPA: hypothetical protein VMS86_00860 [Thermoanaerobaculia bacterium]|nr:hypothetical protein [Thermoanaerobaculia bacterium]